MAWYLNRRDTSCKNGYKVPPKSACIGCPFHSDYGWLELKRNFPDEWKQAVEFEKTLHEYGLRQMRGKVYLHKSCVPLEEVDINENQLEMDFDGFGNECSGHCAT
ncbi:hypothetical protein ERIC2_c22340 [Paenibacillus larvae subsp. larvae DSM 25430]|uniref:Uncharacterized protein n=1 Tax=Paenibacillus larvae subsp. larvae DSM 25430 TaxID=697284 RepID=V9W4S0_9BACL|nr:hypothetical protein ERIC2_c22340 [Paenibacillus larvae subsp. larvae DSM 25430]